jgi:hypothetical protein
MVVLETVALLRGTFPDKKRSLEARDQQIWSLPNNDPRRSFFFGCPHSKAPQSNSARVVCARTSNFHWSACAVSPLQRFEDSLRHRNATGIAPSIA